MYQKECADALEAYFSNERDTIPPPAPPDVEEQRQAVNSVEFDFHGDKLAVVPKDGKVFMVIKRACEYLGVDPWTQQNKLKQATWAVTRMIPVTGSDGKTYEMLCLELDSLPIWLARIEENKVRPELRNKLVVYQVECARALRDRSFDSKYAATSADAACRTREAGTTVRIAPCSPRYPSDHPYEIS